MNSLYCDVVGAEITKEICNTRRGQAQAFRGKGEPHPSLEKCMICEKIEALAEEVQEVAEDWGLQDKEELICVHCKRPPEALKSVWIKKRQMHHTCYNNQNTRGEPRKPQIKRGLKHYSFPEDTIDSLMIENIKLKTIIETIDNYAPVADSTCTDPGITFSEAVRRSLIDDKHMVFSEDKY